MAKLAPLVTQSRAPLVTRSRARVVARWLALPLVLSLAPSLALSWSCAIEGEPGIGAPCDVDDDCPPELFCGAETDAELPAQRVCVPDADCDPRVFGAACAGAGLYSCLDGSVIWTSCEPGVCERGACVP